MTFIVAIDGAAGTGKGTIARGISKEFNFTDPISMLWDNSLSSSLFITMCSWGLTEVLIILPL